MLPLSINKQTGSNSVLISEKPLLRLFSVKNPLSKWDTLLTMLSLLKSSKVSSKLTEETSISMLFLSALTKKIKLSSCSMLPSNNSRPPSKTEMLSQLLLMLLLESLPVLPESNNSRKESQLAKLSTPPPSTTRSLMRLTILLPTQLSISRLSRTIFSLMVFPLRETWEKLLRDTGKKITFNSDTTSERCSTSLPRWSKLRERRSTTERWLLKLPKDSSKPPTLANSTSPLF